MASIILPANPSEPRAGRFGVYGGRYVPEIRHNEPGLTMAGDLRMIA
ncbi:MAG: hypothetical protein ABSB50_02915 [Terracidiphilus sp.]